MTGRPQISSAPADSQSAARPPGSRLYRTEDLASWRTNGNLQLVAWNTADGEQEPDPDQVRDWAGARVTSGGPVTRPGTAAEQMLPGICFEMLGRNNISVDDNFFSIGGHSLLAVHLIFRVQAILKYLDYQSGQLP